MNTALRSCRAVHLVGIKGVAMASLAVYLAESGVRVTGSDVADDFPTSQELVKAGIVPMVGFDPSHVSQTHPDMVVYTGAHGGRENPEVVAGASFGLPVLPHGKALGELMRGTRQIVATGCHGKTTTGAMVATLLSHAKLSPSFAIGCGSIAGLGAGGHYGKGQWFVAEGDEYVTDPGHDTTPRFHWLSPEILIVTNIDYDHPDAYPTLDAVKEAFALLQKKSTLTIYNADDPNCRVLADASGLTFGFSPAATYRITHIAEGKERMFFTLSQNGVSLGEFSLRVPGRHNVLNATAALIAGNQCGISWDTMREGIREFTGTKRRFEKLATIRGAVFYDDYAHHPAEIAATLSSARQWYPDRRMIAVFQPHTYSRTKSLMSEFAKSFSSADIVYVTDIYASAREHDTLGISGESLVAEASKHHANVRYAKDAGALASALADTIAMGDVCLFMGAGDIYNWEAGILDVIRKEQP